MGRYSLSTLLLTISQRDSWNRRLSFGCSETISDPTDLTWLSECPGSLLEVSVRPTDFGFPARLARDDKRECFGSTTLTGLELCVLWDKVEAVAAGPWARQFRRYYSK